MLDPTPPIPLEQQLDALGRAEAARAVADSASRDAFLQAVTRTRRVRRGIRLAVAAIGLSLVALVWRSGAVIQGVEWLMRPAPAPLAPAAPPLPAE